MELEIAQVRRTEVREGKVLNEGKMGSRQGHLVHRTVWAPCRNIGLGPRLLALLFTSLTLLVVLSVCSDHTFPSMTNSSTRVLTPDSRSLAGRSLSQQLPYAA